MSSRFNYPFAPIGWQASPQDFAQSVADVPYMGLYTAEATQRFMLGTRKLSWDGRVFRYAKCGLTFTSTTFGLKNTTCLVSNRVAGTTTNVAAPATAVAGVMQATVTFTAGELGDSTSVDDGERTGVIAEDELRGGYVHFQTIPVGGTEYDMTRLIIGNTAVAVGDTSMILYLDAPLNYALTGGTSTSEILASPYANVRRGNNSWTSVMGMPNVPATTSQHLWLQTWGPLRISPTTDTPAAQQRQWIFDDQGAVRISETTTTTASFQHAGFLLEATSGYSAYDHAPFIMLQISP